MRPSDLTIFQDEAELILLLAQAEYQRLAPMPYEDGQQAQKRRGRVQRLVAKMTVRLSQELHPKRRPTKEITGDF